MNPTTCYAVKVLILDSSQDYGYRAIMGLCYYTYANDYMAICERRKPKGHSDEKLRELPEAAEIKNRRNSWKLVKGELSISDHPQTLRVIRHCYKEQYTKKSSQSDSRISGNSKNYEFTSVWNTGYVNMYRQKHKRVNISVVKHWFRQILRGILYLHGHDPPVIHRDLKYDNIFVNGNQGEVIIGDLGLAVIFRKSHAAYWVGIVLAHLKYPRIFIRNAFSRSLSN
ncbi:hypothetical protein LguiA_002338 [Lonicera macranthoides]